MQRFKNKVIWITGASSGIGKACAFRFAEEGAILILTALETDLLENVKTICLEKGASTLSLLPIDLSKTDFLHDLVIQAWNIYGKIDILFNNAGISQRGNTIDTTIDVIHKIMDVNFFAPVIISKAVLPMMLKQGNGHFVTTTSIAGKFGFPLRSAYCSSKHALYGFFETIQAEYYNENIRVTFVCPGRVRTNISFYALEKDGSPHGKLDDGQAQAISSEKAAKQIINAIYKQKREVLIGGKELSMTYIKRFFPGLSALLARKIKTM